MNSPRRVALITGGTSGIGAGIARALSADFDLAVGFEKNLGSADSVCAELAKTTRVRAYQAKLAGLQDVQDLYTQVVREFEQAPSVLVHSAGRISDSLFITADFAEQASLIQQHLLVGMALTKVCLKEMCKQSFGRILFISSLSAHQHRRGQAAYAAAKSGIESFGKTLALEVAHRGVTVNCIAPGLIESPMTAHIVKGLQESQTRIRDKVPVGFIGQPEDVGGLAKFLCSNEARYITGTVIPIDGGQSIGDLQS